MTFDSFDPKTPQQRLVEDAVKVELKAAETAALAEIRRIRAIGERHTSSVIRNAASATLMHVETMAAAEKQALFRHGVDRDAQRRK